MKYYSRIAEKKFLRMSETFPVVLVTGARQTGKTTMLEHLSGSQPRTYVTLDDINARDLAQNDPVLFFQTYKTPIIIDEVQYAPQLFPQIKLMSDKNKSPGEFWLTGSQSYHAMKGISESLAGRVGILEMSCFIMDEIMEDIKEPLTDFCLDNVSARYAKAKKYTVPEMFEFIYRGGMPKTIGISDEARKDYYTTYINTYLMRDAMELGKISDVVRFNRFITACAASIADQLNVAKLAGAADISQPTAKEWLNVLQGFGVIYLLQPYSNNELKRLVKSPKLYFYDTGLAAYLSQWPSADTLKVSAVAGAYFENFVINQFLRKFSYMPLAPNAYYYRDTDGNEVDLVLESYNGLTPIEVKLSSNPAKKDVSKFSVLEKFGKPVAGGGIVCTIDKAIPADDKNILIPIWSV